MFILIDKPKGITSHDVVDRVREVTGEKRVGHGGTLDPNATGLLIVAVGRESTKKIWKLLRDAKKVYEAEIVLGEERDTDDTTGMLRFTPFTQHDKVGLNIVPTLSNVKSVVEMFIGEQEQVPPQYSAIKTKGKKAYESARRGVYIQLKQRKVAIYSIKLISYKFPFLKVKMEVSGGTYIRSFARDLGRILGTGAYLNNLRRTKIGKYLVKDSAELKSLNRRNLNQVTTM